MQSRSAPGPRLPKTGTEASHSQGQCDRIRCSSIHPKRIRCNLSVQVFSGLTEVLELHRDALQ